MSKKSRFFWIYSIALFAVAFVLILISSFSSNKYQNELNEKATLYQGAQQSLSALTDENERLTLSEKTLKSQVEALTAQNAQLTQEKLEAEETRDKTAHAYDLLLEAQRLVDAKQYAQSKNALALVNADLLLDEGKTRYNKIKAILY